MESEFIAFCPKKIGNSRKYIKILFLSLIAFILKAKTCFWSTFNVCDEREKVGCHWTEIPMSINARCLSVERTDHSRVITHLVMEIK